VKLKQVLSAVIGNVLYGLPSRSS